MAGFTNDLADDIYNHLTGKSTWTAPANLYVALFTAAPSDAGGGTEVTGGSYARESTSGSDWNTPTNGSGTNANAVDFGTATANWGTVTHAGIFDASSGGNLLKWAQLTTSKTINNGDAFQIPAGSLTLDCNAN